MLNKYFKQSLLILLIGCLCGGVQTKECFSCEGINCLRTSKVSNKLSCMDPMDSCVTVFEGSTVIARGCYSTIPEEHRLKCDNTNNSECHKCYKSLCNDKGAINCLQCSSENNADCYSGVAKMPSIQCSVATSSNSYCYTRKSSNKIERGCLIDTSEQLKCFADDACEICIADGEDACNRESVNDNSIDSGCDSITIYGVLLLTTCLILALL